RSLVGATPQGWLRQWDASGAVAPSPLASAEMLLPHVRALILSREDIGATADAVFGEWARTVPLIAVTSSRDGPDIWANGVRSALSAGYPDNEVDPTGA